MLTYRKMNRLEAKETGPLILSTAQSPRDDVFYILPLHNILKQIIDQFFFKKKKSMFVFSCLQQKMGRISTVIFQTFILVDGKYIISECLFVLSIQTYLWMFLCCMHGFLVLKC